MSWLQKLNPFIGARDATTESSEDSVNSLPNNPAFKDSQIILDSISLTPNDLINYRLNKLVEDAKSKLLESAQESYRIRIQDLTNEIKEMQLPNVVDKLIENMSTIPRDRSMLADCYYVNLCAKTNKVRLNN